MLLQVPKDQNPVGRLICGLSASLKFWLLKWSRRTVRTYTRACRCAGVRETSGRLSACHLWTPVVATVYTVRQGRTTKLMTQQSSADSGGCAAKKPEVKNRRDALRNRTFFSPPKLLLRKEETGVACIVYRRKNQCECLYCYVLKIVKG